MKQDQTLWRNAAMATSDNAYYAQYCAARSDIAPEYQCSTDVSLATDMLVAGATEAAIAKATR